MVTEYQKVDFDPDPEVGIWGQSPQEDGDLLQIILHCVSKTSHLWFAITLT